MQMLSIDDRGLERRLQNWDAVARLLPRRAGFRHVEAPARLWLNSACDSASYLSPSSRLSQCVSHV